MFHISSEFRNTPWSECSEPCGIGSKTRDKICFQDNVEAAPDDCDGFIKKTITVECENKRCPGIWLRRKGLLV